MAIRAGELRHRITLRAVTRTEDEGGGYTETPTDVGVVWAKVEPLQGTEQAAFLQTGMTAPHRFTIRYQEGVTGATEIGYEGKRFNVTSVTDPDAARRELVILADQVRS